MTTEQEFVITYDKETGNEYKLIVPPFGKKKKIEETKKVVPKFNLVMPKMPKREVETVKVEEEPKLVMPKFNLVMPIIPKRERKPRKNAKVEEEPKIEMPKREPPTLNIIGKEEEVVKEEESAEDKIRRLKEEIEILKKPAPTGRKGRERIYEGDEEERKRQAVKNCYRNNPEYRTKQRERARQRYKYLKTFHDTMKNKECELINLITAQ